MRRHLKIRSWPRVCLAALPLLCASAGFSTAEQAPPRLLVVVSVDQMRADLLERLKGDFRRGFKRLLAEGAVFPHARHAHVPTETAPGHAAILTGCSPAEHGIVGNDWWDRASRRALYAVEDPLYERSPRQLLCYTVGDALKAEHPEARVVSLSGKDRAAILLGGHRPDLALWFDRKSGVFETSRYYGPPPPWLDRFNRREGAGGSGARAGFLGIDRSLLRLAMEASQALRLGEDARADILALSFSAMDWVGHAKGPHGPELRGVALNLDAVLGDLLDALDRKLGPGNYALILTADHGLQAAGGGPEGELGARRLVHKDFLRRAQAAVAARLPAGAGDGRDAAWIESLSPPHLYLNRELAARRGVSGGTLVEEAASALRNLPEVEAVFTGEELEGYRTLRSTFAAVFRRSYFPGRSGDLLILFREGVMYSWKESGFDHGSPYDGDALVPLILWGAGIRPGVHREAARVADIAPTAARLLGLTFPPRPGGRVLDEALR